MDVYQSRGKWPANSACVGHDSIAPRRPVSQPNKSFKPNLLRYTSNMAGKACHVAGSATQVGLTQALGLTKTRFGAGGCASERSRSEEHTSELQSLMRISYAVFCLKKKQTKTRDQK